MAGCEPAAHSGRYPPAGGYLSPTSLTKIPIIIYYGDPIPENPPGLLSGWTRATRALTACDEGVQERRGIRAAPAPAGTPPALTTILGCHRQIS